MPSMCGQLWVAMATSPFFCQQRSGHVVAIDDGRNTVNPPQNTKMSDSTFAQRPCAQDASSVFAVVFQFGITTRKKSREEGEGRRKGGVCDGWCSEKVTKRPRYLHECDHAAMQTSIQPSLHSDVRNEVLALCVPTRPIEPHSCWQCHP